MYYYDKANRVTVMLNDNTGEETVYTYYPSGAVKNIITKHNGKETDRLYYEYDKDGNRTLELGSDAIKQYTYDEQGRLKKSITDLNYVTGYEYDDFNNISVVRTLYGGVMTSVYYEYDGNNRLIRTTDEYNVTTYEYDNNGNMIRSDGEETADYIFNGAGELTEVWQDNGVYSYEYDHTGLRTSKTADGKTTEMITDGMYVVAEYTGTQSTYYYRGLNLMGYVSDDEISYYRFNAHEDVVAVVDGFGETLKTYKYDAFGGLEEDGNEWLWRVLGVYEEDTNPFRYCAEYYDKETEFIYLRARYYSPEIQRFISEDPIKDGINWYAYCGNNPVMFVDPSGLVVTEWDEMNCTTEELKQLKKNTKKWKNGTEKEKREAEESSRKIRESHLTKNDKLFEDGTVETIFSEDFKVDNDETVRVGATVKIVYARKYEEGYTTIRLISAMVAVYPDRDYEIEEVRMYCGQTSVKGKSEHCEITTTRSVYTEFFEWGSVIDDRGAGLTLVGATVIIKVNQIDNRYSNETETLEIYCHTYQKYWAYNGENYMTPDWAAAIIEFPQGGR